VLLSPANKLQTILKTQNSDDDQHVWDFTDDMFNIWLFDYECVVQHGWSLLKKIRSECNEGLYLTGSYFYSVCHISIFISNTHRTHTPEVIHTRNESPLFVFSLKTN